MGWRMATTRLPSPRKISHTRRVVWLLPLPVRTAQMATTGLLEVSMVCFGPIRR